MNLLHLTQKVRDRIEKNETTEAIALLREAVKGHRLENTILIRAAEQYGLQQETLKGTLAWNTASLSQNQINLALLGIIEKIEKEEIAATKIFISYSKDKVSTQLATNIRQRLKKVGFLVFMDTEDIPPGADRVQTIFSELKKCQYYIYLISEATSGDEIRIKEVTEASRLKQISGVPIIIPIRVAISDAFSMPPRLAEILDPIQQLIWRKESDTRLVVAKMLDLMYGRSLAITESEPSSSKASTYARSTKQKVWQWIVTAGVIVALLAGLAELTGYSLRDIDAFSVTVLVHGKEGRDHRILKNQGKVVIDIGTDRREASINEKGEATFKEIPLGFLGQSALISIDHPQPYSPKERNKDYQLEEDKAIYLEVELSGLNRITGLTLDFDTERPLDSVRVSYDNNVAFTNEFGEFELKIPEDSQDKFIKVNFYKKGYKIEQVDSIAPHLQQPIGLSLKKE